jgi:hypothetical protein
MHNGGIFVTKKIMKKLKLQRNIPIIYADAKRTALRFPKAPGKRAALM